MASPEGDPLNYLSFQDGERRAKVSAWRGEPPEISYLGLIKLAQGETKVAFRGKPPFESASDLDIFLFWPPRGVAT